MSNSASETPISYSRFAVTISLSHLVSELFACDRQTDGQTTRIITTAGLYFGGSANKRYVFCWWVSDGTSGGGSQCSDLLQLFTEPDRTSLHPAGRQTFLHWMLWATVRKQMWGVQAGYRNRLQGLTINDSAAHFWNGDSSYRNPVLRHFASLN